jgi:hypothetical protein
MIFWNVPSEAMARAMSNTSPMPKERSMISGPDMATGLEPGAAFGDVCAFVPNI